MARRHPIRALPGPRRTGLCVSIFAALSLFAAPSAQAAVPQIGAVWSSEVFATSAKLRAEINPEGAATAYHFDYIADAAYQANLNASREGFFGAAKAPAGTDPSVGSGTSVKAVFQTLGSLAPETAYRYRVVAHSTAGTVETARAFTTQSLAGASLLLDGRGWEMVSPIDKNGGAIQGPGQNFGGDVLQAAASGEAVTYSSSASFAEGAQSAPSASQYISARAPSGWSTQNITAPGLAGAYGDHPDGVPYQLFSEDLARGLLLNGRRCAEGEECPRSYSLWEGGAFTELPEASGVRFEGASPDLRHIVLGTDAGLEEWSGEAPVTLSPAPSAALAAQSGAVSEDGSRVYFTEAGNLYLSQDGQSLQPDESVGGGGEFQTASADGAVAFFTKGQHLYRYLAGATASDITPSGGVLGVLGASADGSQVYYATGSGVFLWNAGTSTLVAAPVAARPAAQESDWPPATGTARVSADGAYLAFLSTASLTGYDNTDQHTGEPDSEVYLYDAAADELTCASCNPTGERPLGRSTIPGAIANGKAPGATDSYKPRALSANGRRLFFDSGDAIVLTDTNDAPDAYEWEAAGVGTCAKPLGCVGLISGGRSSEGASFVDASTDGHDAFFLTDGSLRDPEGMAITPEGNVDPGSVDLYDAREGGGFSEPEMPIACEGDACQSLVPEPEDPDPGTLLSSTANPPPTLPKPRKCKQGFARRHGRCARKAHHKRGHK
jgi:hypothetical protein